MEISDKLVFILAIITIVISVTSTYIVIEKADVVPSINSDEGMIGVNVINPSNGQIGVNVISPNENIEKETE